MKRNNVFILAVASLGLAMLACQALTGGGNNTAIPTANTEVVAENTDSPVSTQSNIGNVLLSDDFSSTQWGVGTDSDSSVEYANEALQFIVFTKNYFVLSHPNRNDYQNVHLEVTVSTNDTDSKTAFGLICNQQASSAGSFYYLAITPAGQYAIAKATAEQSDIFLTNNNEWGSSDAIAQDASSYRIGADCGNGQLTLYVDGQQIASASDVAYTNGAVGVFTWSDPDAVTTNITFDDFLMTQLP